ncbi:hypothetical protein K461DRAFT_273679 [Myriangium duriaei CBS 260.36]|uniref:Uncharacterized protein n=1 Tax=Myriangium duriaei CBS 260.36 TaxID=1168546 RepID=A0A9P4MJU2_9PEZI|nr:hypothetical protein K461DRAFT_273679 [Myriangium duriaei CBS 260.36]
MCAVHRLCAAQTGQREQLSAIDGESNHPSRVLRNASAEVIEPTHGMLRCLVSLLAVIAASLKFLVCMHYQAPRCRRRL